MANFFISSLKHWRQSFTPFLAWIGELKNPAVLKADIIAGITVALVLIPQAMAYAQLAGLPPHIGLYAAFLVPIIAALFGSSRQLQNGPVAIISLMTVAALQPMNLSLEQYIAYAAILALLVGIFQLILGLLRLGVIVDFLSQPVIIGFTSAAAIVIGSLQLSKIFGVTPEKGDHLYETLWNLLNLIPTHTHYPTLVFGIFSLYALVVFKGISPKLPGILLTVIISTSLSWIIDYEAMGGMVVGHIPAGLPSFSVPNIEMNHLSDNIYYLILPALVIALLSFVEAFSIAKAVASETRQRISANQEMVGKGLANLTSGVTQGYAVSGSFSRTAVAFAAGARTGFAAIVSGLLVGLTLLYLTPLLYHLPLATLAAVIIIAVVGLIKYAPFHHAWRVNKHDGFVAFSVFIATLAFAPHLEWGIFIGVSLSLIFYFYRSTKPHFAEVSLYKDDTYRDAHIFGMKTSETITMFRYDGDLYFANAGYLEKKIVNAVAEKPQLKVLFLDLEAVEQIDATGEEMLAHLSERLDHAGIEFFILRPKFKVEDALKRSGLYDQIGKSHFFAKREVAITFVEQRYGDEINTDHLRYYQPVDTIKNT